MANVRQKLATARRLYRSEGMPGVAGIAIKKLGAWWRHGEYWEVGRLVGQPSNTVRVDGCSFSMDSSAISEEVKHMLLWGEYEKPERRALKQFLDPVLPVIEFGGCMGVVSCLANKKLQDPRKHVVVEANPSLLTLLGRNRDRNNCHFTVVHGAVAYGTDEVTFYVDDNALASSAHRATQRSVRVPTITLRQIVEQFGFERRWGDRSGPV